MNDQAGWTTIAAMLGTSAAVLRAAAQPWVDDPRTPPMTQEQFRARLAELNAIAGQLNDTNATEQHITDALDPADIPPSMGTQGVRRLASDE